MSDATDPARAQTLADELAALRRRVTELAAENAALRAADLAAQVRMFHATFGFHVADTPAIPPDQIRIDRATLVGEEAAEVVAELLAGLPAHLRGEAYRRIVAAFTLKARPQARPVNLGRLAHELVDLEYVTHGGKINAGLVALWPALFAEVHRANMAKVWPDGTVHWDSRGAAVKPDGWRRADVAAVLDAHRTDTVEAGQ